MKWILCHDWQNSPFAFAMCHFGQNCMDMRWAQIYHLKLVEKNHARLCKFLLQAFVHFYDVLIGSYLFLIVPERFCSINLNWNNIQLYSSVKKLYNVPSSVFWFIHFCLLPFLHRTSIQKWKKNWFCYVCKWIDKKEMSAKTSKYIALAKILERKGSISPFSF